MRLQELLESNHYNYEDETDGHLSPLSDGHKKTIDIIGLASVLGRNFLTLGKHAHIAKHKLRQVGMYRSNLEEMLNSLVRQKGPDGSCKNEILDWIESHEPETYTELQIKQLTTDPKTKQPRSQGRLSRVDTTGRLSPIT